jgi:phosphoribosylformylglycinamidine cyclo-ligase
VRVLPLGVGARVDARAWEPPVLFRWLVERGGVPDADARASFNLGIGMIVVVPPGDADAVAAELRGAGEVVHEIGALEAGAREVRWHDP